MIKTTVLTLGAFWRVRIFREYVAENGKSVYTVDYRIVTKEEGNKEFLEAIKKADHYRVKKTTDELNDEETLQVLDKQVDHYVEYIDDYRQYKSACAHNEELYNIMSAFKDVMCMETD